MKPLRRLTAILLTTAALSSAASLVYVGTYTRAKSKGIYVFRFDETTGKLTPLGVAAETTNPSYVTLHPTGNYLYAANEVGNFQGQKSGSLTAFSLDRATGKLTQLNQISSKGGSPCHMSVDKSGRTLVAANYSGDNLISCLLKADGSLGEVVSEMRHEGSGPNASRQKGPHPHSFNISADGKFAVGADLGTDQMYVYRLDAATAKLEPNTPPATKLAPGSGPRHFAFHPAGRFAYSINELASTITAYQWDGMKGTLTEIQSQTTLPKDFGGNNSTAEVVVHPNGRFVYGSNRGHDSIAVFAVDPAKGTLTLVEHVSSQGKTPRNFNIDPSGKWMIAANQDTDNIAVYSLDPATGKLKFTGQSLEVGAPVCVKFLALR